MARKKTDEPNYSELISETESEHVDGDTGQHEGYDAGTVMGEQSAPNEPPEGIATEDDDAAKHDDRPADLMGYGIKPFTMEPPELSDESELSGLSAPADLDTPPDEIIGMAATEPDGGANTEVPADKAEADTLLTDCESMSDAAPAPLEPEPVPGAPKRQRVKAAPDEQTAKTPKVKSAKARKKTIYDLNLNELDRNLSEEERREWSAIYASFRAKSVLSGMAIGTDRNTFDIRNRDSGELEKKTLSSLIIIDYRVKVLIPESEMWMPGEERPDFVLRNMTGTQIDYVIMEIDREGQCAIGSRRMALAAKRHFFRAARGGHKEGDLLKCRVVASGPKRITVECGGYDIELSQRDLSYTAIPDLRERYFPGLELTCKLKEYDPDAGRLSISVREVKPNPFIGADARHPVGSRRQAVISGKYGGGVFCTMPDDTVCLCLYSSQHNDMDFDIGDSVIIVLRQYDYEKQLIFGRILAKWW